MKLLWLGLCLGLFLGVVCGDEDHGDMGEEVTVETVKQEDDIAYITPDHHPDVFFSDHFDHKVS